MIFVLTYVLSSTGDLNVNFPFHEPNFPAVSTDMYNPYTFRGKSVMHEMLYFSLSFLSFPLGSIDLKPQLNE